MVRGFDMDSQDRRICKADSGFSSVTVDYNRAYDEDCFGDILNIFDFPMENLDLDGLAEDWASKLGPIPSEIFRELLPPASQIVVGNGNGKGSFTDLPLEYPVLNSRTSGQKHQRILDEETSVEKQQPTFSKLYPSPGAFETASPKSVLENRSSSCSKAVSFGTQITIPARTRSKRLRPTANPWLLSPLINKQKKRKTKTPSQLRVNVQMKKSHERSNAVGIKKCTHCEITKTPQWREGPMGPKTLCNACGVRFRSGRLYPEYRPAASPTFVPSLHSNSHRKVIQMRQKGIKNP